MSSPNSENMDIPDAIPLALHLASDGAGDSSFGIVSEEHYLPRSFYFNQICNLFNEQLFSSVLSLGSFVMTLVDKLQDGILTEVEHLQVIAFCGDSASQLNDFPRAESLYKKANQMYKYMSKLNPHFKDKLAPEFQNDVKYKIYLCQMRCKKPMEAMNTLQTIPAKHRTVRVNIALGKLYLQNGMERAAVTSFKEVIKECPMAMDVIELLLSLGLKETDILSIVQQKTQDIVYGDWFKAWLTGSAAFHSRDYTQALTIYSQLQEKSALLNNHTLLVTIGTTYAMTGDYEAGIGPLKVAHMNDCCNFNGMDLLAFLLWSEKRKTELEKLAFKMLEYNYTETKPEPYVAMAYFCQLTNRNHKALNFAERANYIQGVKNPESLICKGNIYLNMKKWQDALLCFREASSLYQNRFEPQKGIFDCYMALKRCRDAMTIATACLKKFGHTPRVLTMCAQPLAKDPTTMPKAKAYLDKALNLDNGFVPAVFMSVDILEREGQLPAALTLLLKLIDSRINPPSVHVRTADLFLKTGQDDKASDHFSIALTLDENYQEAIDGLLKLDPAFKPVNYSSNSMEEIEVDDDEDEDNEDSEEILSSATYANNNA